MKFEANTVKPVNYGGKKKKESPGYHEWEEGHKASCQINHQESSGSMESCGALQNSVDPLINMV